METTNQTNPTNQPNPTTEKNRVYNLIILDKSGSMGSIREAAYQGCNEVLSGLRTAAAAHADEQELFVSLLLFDTESKPYLYRLTPAAEAADIRREDFVPCGCTPLYDAMGMALTDLEHVVDSHNDAVGSVTIITDGYENASTEYSGREVCRIVERLKEKGWTFAFMGANQDVMAVASSMGIKNSYQFEASDAGMRSSWEKERHAKMAYLDRMCQQSRASKGMSKSDRMMFYCNQEANIDYYADPSASASDESSSKKSAPEGSKSK